MASVFQKASSALRGAANPDGQQGQSPKQDEGESLTTILVSPEDRGALTVLVCEITERMRKQILDTFDPNETGSQDDQFEPPSDPSTPEESHTQPEEGRSEPAEKTEHDHFQEPSPEDTIQVYRTEDDSEEDEPEPRAQKTETESNAQTTRADAKSQESTEEDKSQKKPADDKPQESSAEDKARDKAARKLADKQKSDLAKRTKEVNDQKMVQLKDAALNFFDDWRDSVILRVGEVVNSVDAPDRPSTADQSQPSDMESDNVLQGVKSSQLEEDADRALAKLYAPIDTPLRKMSQAKRTLVLHSLLLLMLSLKHYRAHSRTLLLYLSTSLGLPVQVLSQDETKIAKGLLSAAQDMSADEETKKRAEENKMARRLKMGAAGVGGALLIGITGGLAAPFLAAGLGTVLGGIGLGATATAGYLGALAGSGVLVGGLFGAYGARMTSKAMEKYTRDVEDFAFIPVRSRRFRQAATEAETHRLRVAIGISGWISDKDDVVLPWRFIGQAQESFALRYELEALMNLGNSLYTLVTSAAWKFARVEIVKRTVFAALMAGLWPLALVNAGRIIDNPWMVANQRAQKAGEVLADAIINKAQGERPVTLVGYSLGAKVIYKCLQELAQRKAFGLVENAIMLGAPTPCSSADWRRIRSVVTGRVVNAYSTKDYILAFLYRSSSIQYGVAGLHPVLNVKGIENVDVSDLVEGHTLYRHATGPILRRIGFEDIDESELKSEEAQLEKQEKEEKEQREAAGGGSGAEEQGASEEELQRMEQEIQQKNKKSSVDWMTDKMKIAGSAPGNAFDKAKSKWNTRNSPKPADQ